jgi:rubrerythrin
MKNTMPELIEFKEITEFTLEHTCKECGFEYEKREECPRCGCHERI